MMNIKAILFLCSWLPLISHGAVLLEDSSLSFDFLTIFTDIENNLNLDLIWEDPTDFATTDSMELLLTVNGEASTIPISLETETELPSSPAVTFMTDKGGRTTVDVEILINGESVGTVEGSIISYGEGASLVPLIIVLILGFTTQMVELSLGVGIFIGACMISGNVQDGFTSTIEGYILNSLADVGHGYVYLFTAFLGGFVALIERSGGFGGFADLMGKFATNARVGQFVTYVSGGIIFFDDYANCLVVGGSLKPILDKLNVSREKLAFIVDATAAPIASLVPLSSWIGFEIGLINDELDKIRDGLADGEELYVGSNGITVFLDSLKYRYYSIFMLLFIPMLILLQRDFGPMLVAERKCKIYDRTDGGDGKGNKIAELSTGSKPEPNTPKRWWNFFVPVFFLIFFIFYILIDYGDDGSGTQTTREKVENSDSWVALLWGTMAAALVSVLFFFLQFKKGGDLTFPTFNSLSLFCGFRGNPEETEDSAPAPLLTVKEATDTFVTGQIKMVPALIVLTLAWAVGAVMTDVGADRLFARWILDSGLNPGALPTISFLIATLLAISTGTSWGTMGILFPLIAGPTYIAAAGDARIFNATVSSILAGAIMGDHVSPISDTTILTCIACDCGLMEHVKTQMPYAGLVALWSVLVGTIPIGYNPGYPNALGIVLGMIFLFISIYFLGAPIVTESGKFDIGTELYLKIVPNAELAKIKEDTAACYKADAPEPKAVGDKEPDEEDGDKPKEDVVTGVEDVA